ncbi:hypothetical protein ACT048_18115 [Ectopseudomonas khazarica]|uniref:hypothetical protein n=1 Tax=Ectopseudomonas khazarica TaxID=2502979 RepID=UPI001792C962
MDERGSTHGTGASAAHRVVGALQFSQSFPLHRPGLVARRGRRPAAGVQASAPGWLARNKRWHHWLLKLYFLLLPLAGGLLGFQADFLLGLLKRQIGHVFKPFYIALLIQLGLLLALVAAEWGVSRWLRQLPARQPVEPLAQL